MTVSVSETATYAASSRDVTVTVNKATLTVTAKSQSIYVNGTVPNLTTPVKDTHYTVTGLVSGDTLSVAMEYRKDGSAAAPDVTKAGSYEIAITATADTEKYEVTNNLGALTIIKPSSGNGGGGGGSNSGTTITVPISSDHATADVKAKVKKGSATVEVSDKQIQKVIADHAGDVTIDVSDPKNIESATAPSHVVEKANKAEKPA